jgi:Holliday junction DNA helicase RuvB
MANKITIGNIDVDYTDKGGATRPEKKKEDETDGILRPQLLEDFIGQDKLKENLSIYIKAAKERDEALDHVFFQGPPGLGKTTLARIIANELQVDFVETSAPALEKPKDLIGILANLKPRSVVFIDEIHRLKPVIEERLYKAMEDYEFDWLIGEGPGARPVSIPLQPFTLIGATTRAGMVAKPLVDRFSIPERLYFYENKDIEAIIHRSAGILHINIDDDAKSLLAKTARGTPRVANRLLRRVRDFAQIAKSDTVTEEIVRVSLKAQDIDPLGLERLDREILKTIIERYSGGPVGAETIAISFGESADTLEDYYEPFLIQAGLLQRTPRGRVATPLAYEHLGIKRKDSGLLL